jgi:hypothetical protein
MTRRSALVFAVAALAVLVLPSSTSAIPPSPQPACSPAPCGGWHNTSVTVSWPAPPAGVTPSGCGGATISQDTSGVGVSCTWSDGGGSVTSTVIIRKDTTPPSVSSSPARGPDKGEWYNRPVDVSFSGSDALSGIASCTSGTYSGPDTGAGSVGGSCSDYAGNTRSTSFGLKYDATPPSVEAKPDRGPNPKGWYNRRVTVAFVGSDATSGVEACAPAVTYAGPDADKTAVSGTCVDKAANTSQAVAYELRYDTRPPALMRVRAEISARGVVLRWRASPDSVAFGIVRSPGLGGKKATPVYTGAARSFTDRRLQKGVRYRYTVTAYDEAGNGAARGLAVRSDVTTKAGVQRPARPATPSLLGPRANARVSAPPVLRWSGVPKATYYNVQLFRNGKKILTLWPSTTSLRLEQSWRFGGRTQRLTPGRYRWYVWPGFGKRAASRYGKLVGSRVFVVTR